MKIFVMIFLLIVTVNVKLNNVRKFFSNDFSSVREIDFNAQGITRKFNESSYRNCYILEDEEYELYERFKSAAYMNINDCSKFESSNEEKIKRENFYNN